MIETKVETYIFFFENAKENEYEHEMKSNKDQDSPALEWLLQLKDQPSLRFSWKNGKQGHLLWDLWDDSVELSNKPTRPTRVGSPRLTFMGGSTQPGLLWKW